jgi:hypothetical protein
MSARDDEGDGRLGARGAEQADCRMNLGGRYQVLASEIRGIGIDTQIGYLPYNDNRA